MASEFEQLQYKIQYKKDDIERLKKEIENDTAASHALMKTKTFYRIHCKPTKTDHSEHNVGLFSTREKAERYLPANAYSYDDDDRCGWNYSIIEVSGNVVLPSDIIDKLDKGVPSHFPYTGW